MIHFHGEMIADGEFFFQDAVFVANFHAQAGIPGGGIHLQPAFRADDAIVAGGVVAVTGGAVGHDTARETELEVYGLLHFLKTRIVRCVVNHGVYFGGLFATEISRGVQGVDADVHHGAAAGHIFFEAPLIGIGGVKAGVCENHLGGAEFAGARNANGLLVVGFVTATVGNHELFVRGAAGVDHFLAFGGSAGHGLFGQHVFAGLEPADGVLGVHAVGQDDVDDVDFRIVFDRVIVLVVVNVLKVDAVAHRELFGFIRMAADKGNQPGLFAFREGRENFVHGETAEAHDGPAQLFSWRLGDRRSLLGGCVFQEGSRCTGGRQAFADFAEKSATRNFRFV